MVMNSKRYRKAMDLVDQNRSYTIPEAVELVKQGPAPKFDETVDCAMKLNVDPKKADQLIRGAVSLPNGIGKSKKVIVFAEGEAAEQARTAGASEVGMEDLAKKVEGGWMDFDVAIATPQSMKVVGKLGKVLGPQGKMPSPKSGTVTADVAQAVKEFQAGKIEFRVDDFGNLHLPVGKRSFPTEDLTANIEFIVNHVKHMRPSTVKGIYMQKVVISSTMGPGVKIVVES